MFEVQKSTDCFSNNLNYVKTCPNGPQPGKAFCCEHLEIMEKNGVPVTLKEYVNFKKHSEFLVKDTNKSSAARCQGLDIVSFDCNCICSQYLCISHYKH